MAGSSWRGDPAATRRGAFDRLQEACADEESARAELETAEKAVRKAQSKLDDAASRRGAALRELHRALPGAPPEAEGELVEVPEDEPAPSAGEG